MNRLLSVLVCLLIVNVALVTIPDSAEGNPERTYPSLVSVTSGTATGVVDAVHKQDYIYYSVVEIDVNDGRSYTNTSLDPDGTGTYNEWFSGMGAMSPCDGIEHWGCVDEGVPHDDDASYVLDQFNEVASTDTYELQDYTLVSGSTIDEIEVFLTTKTVPAGVSTVSPAIFPGIALDVAGSHILSSSYVEYSTTWGNNPDDGESWEEADIDTLEAGSQHLGGGDEALMTLVYVRVQSSAPLDDYTVLFQFEFTGIRNKNKPILEVAGLRTGDSEAILVQVLRSGTWITLSSDAFGTSLTTSKLALSTTDVVGGSATVRIVDADPTDDSQSSVFIDEIVILTEEEEDTPGVPITVQTKTQYDLWGNRLKVYHFVSQSGGSEKGLISDRWITVMIDGHQASKPSYAIPAGQNFTYVDVSWNYLDGGTHNISVQGWATVDWTAGPLTYASVPEDITLDSSLRLLIILTILMIILILLTLLVVIKLDENRRAKESLERRLKNR